MWTRDRQSQNFLSHYLTSGDGLQAVNTRSISIFTHVVLILLILFYRCAFQHKMVEAEPEAMREH